MVTPELKRLVASVGQGVFVRYFRQFADETLGNQEVADLLPRNYTLKSRLSRTSHARGIIRRGLTIEALQMISDSKRADVETVHGAGELLRGLR